MKLIELPVDLDGMGKPAACVFNPEAVDVITPVLNADDECKIVLGDDEYTVYLPMAQVRKLVEEGMNS